MNSKTGPWWQKKVNLKYWQIFSIVLFIILICAIVWFLNNQKKDISVENMEKHYLSDDSFISPLLECADVSSLYSHGLESELNKVINNNIKNKKADFVSLYYRDLNNGPWIGINEGEKFSPASLLKVPLMMAYFKIAETQTEILQEKIKITKKPNEFFQNISPAKKTQENQEYTIEELIEYMIIYSDNDASDALIEYMENIDAKNLDKVYVDLGIEIPGTDKLENFMKIKEYASFFRILYNSSYLNKEMSIKSLLLLSKSNFNQGLRAGIPPYIKISHKFGERSLVDGKQLHDCGIVYKPNEPYLLCIMTRGTDFNLMNEVIQEISQTVYEKKSFK
jgi:beta-lactamase class A